jgi:hypothetical protein
MRVTRLLGRSFALVLALTLSGVGVSSNSQSAAPHASPPVSQLTSSHIVASPAATAATISTWNAIASPKRLVIPRIGINALVESVSVLSNGNLATPDRDPWDEVGWYQLGPRPGEEGSAVIDGHLDRPGGFPAVFWKLREMHIGDEVIVVDRHGNTLRFRTTHIAFYSPEDAPLQEIFGSRGGIFLNLITCAGDWIPSQHQTSLRLVVFTSLEK